MNFHRASNSVVRAVKRRLETAQPPARLVEDSIKRFSLPGTHHQITLFIAEGPNGKRIFVAELIEPDLPHIYQSLPLPEPHSKWKGGAKADAAEISKIMLTAILGIAQTVQSDPRFRRNIITLDSVQLDHAIQQLNGNKKI
jgi:hypothetical protein